MSPDLARTHRTLVQRLLAAAERQGYWEGRLASSALATATAVVALQLAKPADHRDAVTSGLAWLVATANADGGWGDTPESHSNLSTTALVWAAFAFAPADSPAFRAAESRAEAWLCNRTGSVQPEALAQALLSVYADDRTFSIPILTMLALCGRLGPDGWSLVEALPFELAAAPHQFYAALRLPVVSYALPALIAIGQVRHHQRPTRNPLTRLLRNLTRKPTLELLGRIQPERGGYLEAVPLTAFVTMSLCAMGLSLHPVVTKALFFLHNVRRADGSWPIDTHLATWVTALSINALGEHLPPPLKTASRAWLLNQQYQQRHPYTHAAPGGWSWTPLTGGVPDADDTSCALLALHRLGPEPTQAIQAGLRWLRDLQNADGGIPTFCRGWGRLPFDQSCPEITAHALAAWMTYRSAYPKASLNRSIDRAIAYLEREQQPAGWWQPLWFGNQHHPQHLNPVYGTARVLISIAGLIHHLEPAQQSRIAPALERARSWLRVQAHDSGGFGAAQGLPPSIEETALAVHALCAGPECHPADVPIVKRSLDWLASATQEGQQTPAVPIGYYFASLWYDEALYPLIFATAAFQAAHHRGLLEPT